jgi:hypothetical protein
MWFQYRTARGVESVKKRGIGHLIPTARRADNRDMRDQTGQSPQSAPSPTERRQGPDRRGGWRGGRRDTDWTAAGPGVVAPAARPGRRPAPFR